MASTTADVAVPAAHLTWLPGWAAAVFAGILLAWHIPRVLPALAIGVLAIVAAALSAGLLPAWVPFVDLPALSGAWIHHRGEVAQVWQWGSTQPTLSPLDWSSLARTDPAAQALAGMLGLAVALGTIAAPLAARRAPE